MSLPLSTRVEERFLPLVVTFGLDALEAELASVYGMWPDSTIGYINPAYARFAEEQGFPGAAKAWGVGARVLDAIPAPLREFYAHLYERASSARVPLVHRYECSSPTLKREYELRLHSLGGQALLAVNAEVVARPHEDPAQADDARYRRPDGLVLQCCHCRRVSRVASPNVWDFVPDYVASSPPQTSHGMCELCAAYYYGQE